MPTAMTSVIGIPSKTTWSSTAVHRTEHLEMWCACSFAGDEQTPHEGRKFIKFFETLQTDDLSELYGQLQHAVEQFRPQTTYSLSFVLQTDSVLFLTFGYGTLGVVRQGNVRWLATGEKEHVVLQGNIHDGDMLVLGTVKTAQLVVPNSLLLSADPEAIVSQLFSRVQQHESSGELAFCFLTHSQHATPAVFVEPVEEPQLEKPAPESVPGRSSETAVRAHHLISPQKLQAGVLASHDEQKTVLAKRNVKRWWEDFFTKWRESKIHWVRSGLAVGVVVLLILVFVGHRAYAIRKEQQEVLAPLQQLSAQLQTGTQQERSQRRSQAQSLLERLKATRIVYNTNRRELEELTMQVEKMYNDVSGEKNVVNLPVFFDFRLVSADFLAGRAALEKEQAIFLDANNSNLMRLNLGTKKNERLPSDGLSSPSDLALVGSDVYTLNGQTIKKLPSSISKHEDFKTVSSLVDGTQMGVFGDSLYVLDRQAQQIWKVGLAPDATASGWVRSARGVDFSTISSLSINGSIWLGSEGGEIYKLSRGEREGFSITGLAEPFTSTLLLGTSLEGEKLVVVEPKKERVVVLSKTGEYLAQIKAPQIGAVTDVFVDDTETSAYLVAGSVVYKVEI